MARQWNMGSSELGCVCEGAGLLFAVSGIASSAARRAGRGRRAFVGRKAQV